jgi:DnaK suppressor protein
MTDQTATQPGQGVTETLHVPAANCELDLAAIRGELEHQRIFRVQQLKELAVTTERDSAEATEEVARQVALALTEAATAVLAEIDAAIERIEEGRYGRCGWCGVDIPPLRLQALPMASFCMPCQTRQELSGAGHRTRPGRREQAALDLLEEWRRGSVPASDTSQNWSAAAEMGRPR